MKRWSVLLWSLFLYVSAGLAGQQADRHAGVVVKAGRVLEVRTGVYRDHQTILIEGDRIREIGDERELRPHVPLDARVVDLSRYTVLPGLIDAHTHLTGSPYLMGYRGLALSVPREALLGARNARVTLEAGFTTVRNVGASGFADSPSTSTASFIMEGLFREQIRHASFSPWELRRGALGARTPRPRIVNRGSPTEPLSAPASDSRFVAQ